MAGTYCCYCGHRCFVYRILPDRSWSGHMATCGEGAAHDREVTGHDHTTAINPVALKTEEREPERAALSAAEHTTHAASRTPDEGGSLQ